jgi:heme-degrading monooxygenase HmoA
MLRTILTLVPRPGAREEIVARYRESGILGLAVREAGCLATELQLPIDPAAPLLVTELWESRADHERWSRHAARTALAARLQPLIAEARTDEYTIAVHAERDDDPVESSPARATIVAADRASRRVQPRGLAPCGVFLDTVSCRRSSRARPTRITRSPSAADRRFRSRSSWRR